MPMLAISGPSLVGSGNLSGDLNWFRPAQSSFSSSFYNSVGHPFVTGTDGSKASMVKYRGRVYGVGGFACQWVFDEFYRVYRSGLPAPETPPVVTTTAGAVSLLAYYSYYDEKTGERGPLSNPSAVFTWNNVAARTWTNPPTYVHNLYLNIGGETTANASQTLNTTGNTPIVLLNLGDQIALSSAPTVFATITALSPSTPSITVDAPLGNGTTQTMIVKGRKRATHIEFWLSVDGADVRLVGRRQLGATTASESVPTLALGEVAPDDFTTFPDCSFSEIYHDRQILAGNPKAPDTVYISELFFPERYGGLNFRTRNGDSVVGLLSVRDVLLVFTKNSTYRLQGYTEDDFTLTLEDADIGCITHFGLSVIYGEAWVPDSKGVFKWNGAYQPMAREVQSFWRKDYKANRLYYETGYAYHDPNDYTYNFVTIRPATAMPDFVPRILVGDEKTFIWSAGYRDTQPELSGTYAQPDWAFDVLDRTLRTAGVLSDPGGKRTDVFGGFCDGIVRIKDPDNADDSGDSYQKQLYIQTAHILYNDPGGHDDDGKTLTELWSYVSNLHNSVQLVPVGGDEEAWMQTKIVLDTTPYTIQIGSFITTNMWKETFPATAGTVLMGGGNRKYLPRGVHYHPVERIVGRGFTFMYLVDAPLRLEFRGLGGKYGPGVTRRGLGQPAGV